MNDKRHEKQNFKKLLKELKTPLSCPAMTWKLKDEDYLRNGDGDFDEEIFPVLVQLNNERWHTVASCAGHTLDDIKTHGMSYGIKDEYRISIYIHSSYKHIQLFMEMTEDMKYKTESFFICTLATQPVKDERSNETENGFLPFVIELYCGTKEKRDRDLLVLAKVAKKHNKK